MSRFWRNTKAAFGRGWAKVKGWTLGVLIALGLVAGLAMATEKNFSWTNPTQNTDGSVFDAATEQAESRIYCGDVSAFVAESPGQPNPLTPLIVTPGDAQTATRDFAVGTYTCRATVVSTYGYESELSGSVTFTITPTVAPAALTDFTVN